MYRIRQRLVPPLCLACMHAIADRPSEQPPANLVCETCFALFFKPYRRMCAGCGDELAPRAVEFGWTHCRFCREKPHPIATVSCYPYFPPVDTWLQALKYRDKWQLAEPLGQWLGIELRKWCVANSQPPPDCLIPIPSSRRSLKKRGYNQALLLARATSRETGILLLNNVLIKTRETERQASHNRESRRLNLLNAFGCNPLAKPPRRVALVDDVITTGSTIDACAGALKAAGVEEVMALAIAKTPT